MRLRAILTQRCPRCLTGKVFRGLWSMHSRCPSCALRFEREPGYFVGAMYFAYFFGVAIVVPASLALSMADFSAWWIAGIAEFQILLLSPFLFRYSRVAWLHLDQVLDPR